MVSRMQHEWHTTRAASRYYSIPEAEERELSLITGQTLAEFGRHYQPLSSRSRSGNSNSNAARLSTDSAGTCPHLLVLPAHARPVCMNPPDAGGVHVAACWILHPRFMP